MTPALRNRHGNVTVLTAAACGETERRMDLAGLLSGDTSLAGNRLTIPSAERIREIARFCRPVDKRSLHR
jgi:hypothetical protein